MLYWLNVLSDKTGGKRKGQHQKKNEAQSVIELDAGSCVVVAMLLAVVLSTGNGTLEPVCFTKGESMIDFAHDS